MNKDQVRQAERDKFKTEKYEKFFKALDTKLFLNLSTAQDRFKKTILELYIREKEEEFFMQHEQEFFTSSSEYYFHFLEKQDKKEFDSYEEKNRYWILFLLSLGPDNNVKKENLLKSLKGLQEKYFSKSPVSLNFSQSEMYDGIIFLENHPYFKTVSNNTAQAYRDALALIEDSKKLPNRSREFLNTVCKCYTRPTSQQMPTQKPIMNEQMKQNQMYSKLPNNQNQNMLLAQINPKMEYNPNNFASKNQSSSLQTKQTVLQNPSVNSMFINEKKLNQNETMKNTNKRNFEEHEDPFSNTNNEKKRMKIDNYTTFNKNETLILTKNSKNSSFQERFEGLLKDYSESLKNSIEKTLSEMKNEGFIVSDNF